jgi:porin
VTRRAHASLLLALTISSFGTHSSADELADGATPFREWDHLTDGWWGARTRLADRGIHFDFAYTGDFVDVPIRGVETGAVYLGNLDLTFTLHSWELIPRDLGTLFVYGLVNHGGRPSSLVGDIQFTDNIEAPTTAKLYEAWWQRAFFDGRASVLAGLYDVNSEFYVVASADLFINSSFGIGPEVAATGASGPSIFPNTSLALRFKVEPIPGYEISAAVMDGVPGDPADPDGTQIQFDAGDGIFFIAEVARYWSRNEAPPRVAKRLGETVTGTDTDTDTDTPLLNPTQRRRLGRTLERDPYFLSVKLGTWFYSSEQPDSVAIAETGLTASQQGHPGVYLLAEFDAAGYSRPGADGLSAFVQLGFADGDVAPFAGYTGAGLVYTGLLPTRPDDSFGVAVAAAYAGDGLDAINLAAGGVPATAEIALEFTYRTFPARWLSLQTDLQYVIHPSALKNRHDALVLSFRYVIDF